MSEPSEIFPAIFMAGWCCFGVIGIALTIFWIWALIDCIANEPSEGNDKIVWLLVVLLLGGLGGLIYFFVRRPQRISQYGK